jgi:hypothetical protein
MWTRDTSPPASCKSLVFLVGQRVMPRDRRRGGTYGHNQAPWRSAFVCPGLLQVFDIIAGPDSHETYLLKTNIEAYQCPRFR